MNTGRADEWAPNNGYAQNANTVHHTGSPCSLFPQQRVLRFAEFIENYSGLEVA